jgi:hypothetical protein
MNTKGYWERIRRFCIAAVICSAALYGCNGDDRTNKDSTDDFDKICIEGHVYYMRTTPYHGYLSIKLDDEGRPIKCNK